MKDKLFKMACLLMVMVITKSCEKSETRNSDCYPNREIAKKAVDVKGMVGILDIDHPNVWSIISMEGIIGHEGPTYDSRDVVIPCNLPEEFKEEGLLVEFSGILIDTEDDFTSEPGGVFYENVYYAELSKIEVNEQCEEVIIDNELYKNAQSDPFEITKITSEKDCLKITLRYGGGCVDVTATLVDSGDILESNPGQRNLRLVFLDDDECEALIQKEFLFDITDLQIENSDRVMLNFQDSNLTYLYEY